VILPGLVRRRDASMRFVLTGVGQPVRYAAEDRWHVCRISGDEGVSELVRPLVRERLRTQGGQVPGPHYRKSGWSVARRSRPISRISRLRQAFGRRFRQSRIKAPSSGLLQTS
jgi:hypothetical protein